MHEHRYVFMVLMAYAWSLMPILFLLSFLFEEATAAYVWVTVINILSGVSTYYYYYYEILGLVSKYGIYTVHYSIASIKTAIWSCFVSQIEF